MGIVLYSCKGGGDGIFFLPGAGPTGVYVTDDTPSDGIGTDGADGAGGDADSVYSQATVTINTIELIDPATGAGCGLLTMPTGFDAASLDGIMELIDSGECGAGPYNRIRIVLSRDTEITDGATGSTSPCSFVSYGDKNNGNQPDSLYCDGDVCELQLNGAVNVLANNGNKLGVSIKNFIVEGFGESSCTVTMKLSPLNASQMKKHGPEAVPGAVSGLNTAADTFVLARGTRSFSVDYSGIAATHPEIDDLLFEAQAGNLRTRVISTEGIDLENSVVVATSVEIEAE